MRASAAALPLLLILLASASTSADPPAEKAAGGAKKVRRDPENKTGISDFMETIAKGEAAFVARDLAGATALFQDAIKLAPTNMLGFYMLGQAMVEQGKLEDADAAYTTALGKKGSESLNAKVLFVIADLRQRQHNMQAAKDAWASYTAFLQNHSKAIGFPATAAAQEKEAGVVMKLAVDYAAVKDRIAKRVALHEAEAIENAKKDKLNR
jgi:predicted Zn-dependent protease